MGLLRLVNAARLAPLEELLAETRGGGKAGSGGGSASGGGNTKAPTPAASFASRTASAGGSGNSFSGATRSAEEAGLAEFKPGAHMESAVPPRVVAPANSFSAGGSGSPSGGGAAAVAPALSAATSAQVPASESKKGVASEGIDASQIVEIKTAIQAQQKFVGELLEHATRWELDGAELRLCFPPEKNTFIGLIEGRETLEKIRNAASKVLGRAVRVCARLDSSAARGGNSSRDANSTQELRAKFEKDPMVKSMLQRFGGRISEVRRPE